MLGHHGTYDAALTARDADVLECLERAGGRRIEIAHEIHRCTEGGACNSRRMVCAVGQPIGWPVDLRAELAETASWLERGHGRGR